VIRLLSNIDGSAFVIKQAAYKTTKEMLLECVSKANQADGTVVQVFDSNTVANRTHLIGAYINSMSSFSDHSNKTKSPSMEMLLFAAMTDQIEEAIDSVGIKEGPITVFSNNKAGFEKIKPMLKDIREFEPSKQHTTKVLTKLGIRSKEDADKLLLQRMALSRLKP